MSARQEPTDPETDDLRRVVEDVAGVASAEIHVDETGRPTIRVHHDGTGTQEAVVQAVRAAVARWRRPDGRQPATARGRRTGLGKGLDSLLAEALAPAAQPTSTDAMLATPTPARVVLVRGDHGSSVQATDTVGTLAVVFVGVDGIEAAVVSAIATLRDVPAPRLLAATVATVGGHDVVTVVLESYTGELLVGSALTGHDRLLAIGRAAWRALES